MNWTTSAHHDTSASPETVFAVWQDVTNWPAWDQSLVAATLDGAFAAGVTGTIHPAGFPEPLPMTITAVEPGCGFTDATPLGELTLTFGHLVAPADGGARITVTVTVDGPGADEMGPNVADDLPESLAALAAEAERRHLSR